MYGDTHVDPAVLFDPEWGGRPPADAWDLYFHAPISLSLLGDASAAHGMERELGGLLNLNAGLAAADVTAENAVPGEPTMHLHTHLGPHTSPATTSASARESTAAASRS